MSVFMFRHSFTPLVQESTEMLNFKKGDNSFLRFWDDNFNVQRDIVFSLTLLTFQQLSVNGLRRKDAEPYINSF